MLGGEQQKWIMELLGFDFEIQFKPGVENRVADALSRRDELTTAMAAIFMVRVIGVDAIMEENQGNEKLARIIQSLLKDPSSKLGYNLKGGSLCFKDWLVLAKGSSFIPRLLKEFHTTFGGHSGTYKRISSTLYWEGMKNDVRKYVAECEIC